MIVMLMTMDAIRLERLLKEAEKKRKRLKQLQQSSAAGSAGGYEQMRGEQWNDALKAASGEKTLIVGSSSIEGSEGKIKKALKKREKKKARSAVQWSERIAATEDDERSKQMVREHNLKKRIMKKKGVDIDDAPGGSSGSGSSGGGEGEGSNKQQPPAKRPRLFMVHKYKEADEKNNSNSNSMGGGGQGGGAVMDRGHGRDGKGNSYHVSKGGSAENRGQGHHSKSSSGGGGGRDGKDRGNHHHHHHSKGGEKGHHRGGGNNNNNNNNNRAGFEGKKRNGEYLNK